MSKSYWTKSPYRRHVANPHNETTLGTRLPAVAPWYHAVAEGGGFYRSPGYIDGTVYIIAVHPLRDFPLVVDAGSTEESVLAIWRRQAVFIAAGMALAAIGVIWLLLVFDRQLRRLFEQNLQLDLSRMQFNAALDNISQGVTFIGADEKLIVANRRYAEIYRLSPAILMPGHSLIAALQSRIENGSFPEVSLQDYQARREVLRRDRSPFEITEELRDGRAVVLRYQPLADGGWVTTHEDITARRRAQAELAFMARHDSLTHLPNRTVFQERLAQAVAVSGRGTSCALMCLDLDGFKAINDTFGHPVGDGLLRAVADRLSAAVREVDTVARVGGDEFVIIQLGLDSPAGAALLAERIIKLIAQPFDIEGISASVGVSIGISLAPGDASSPGILVRNADSALYVAKQQGRRTYRFFSMEMDAERAAATVRQ